MLTSQRDAVFEVVQESALRASDFYWDTVLSSRAGKDVSRVVHRPTGYYFIFDELRGKHYSQFSPGAEQLEEEQYPGSWALQLGSFQKWLDYLEREISAPDLWQTVTSYTGALPDLEGSSPGNEKFSEQEKSRVRAALGEVKEYVREALELSNDRFDAVEHRLDYLAAAVERQGRTDWVHTAIGMFATLALGGIVPPDAATEFLRHALTTLKMAASNIPGLPWR